MNGNNGTSHWCSEHKSIFYRNEKNKDDGTLSVWYSHKTTDPKYTSGYHNETVDRESRPESVANYDRDMKWSTAKVPPANSVIEHTNFDTCNAMNNAMAAVIGGIVGYADLETVYDNLLKILEKDKRNG